MKPMTMLAGAALASLLVIPANAQTTTNASGEFTLQGRLTTSNGGAVANGTHSLMLKVYNRTTGQVMYSETDMVTTVDGVFTTMVGDNGDGGSELMVDAGTQYDLGVSVNSGAEMMPRLHIGDALSAVTADVAAQANVALNANAIGGLRLFNDTNRTNAIVTTNASGRLNAGLLDTTGLVTSINGMRGNVNFQGGGNLNVATSGNTVTLSLNGGGGGSFSLPYTQTVNLGTGQSGFNVTNSGAGSAASFANAGAGSALSLQSTTGSAITATSNTSGTGTINVTNTAGTAINAMGNASTGAVLTLQNTGSGANAGLISALDASGNMALQVAANGKTTIRSSVGNALDVSTSAAGETALKVTGGLSLNGPVGTGTLDLSSGSVTINNPYAKANSVIMVTATSATNAATIVPIRISSQGSGSFTVAAIPGALGALTGSLSFNYLIINQ